MEYVFRGSSYPDLNKTSYNSGFLNYKNIHEGKTGILFAPGPSIKKYKPLIDDNKSTTILSFSTLDIKVKSKFKNTGNKEAASEIGKILGDKAKEKGIKKVIFDRGKCLYHGRIKALADSARKAGLDF